MIKRQLVPALVVCLLLLVSGIAVSAGGCDPEQVLDCDADTGFDISVRYPLSIVSYDFAQTQIAQFIADSTQNFLSAFSATDLPEFVTSPWFLDIASEEMAYSDDIISVVMTVSDYTGGAHGNVFYKTFTFDLSTEKQLTLNDLFTAPDPLPTLFPLVSQELQNQMDGYADLTWIEDGTGLNIDNYQNFAVGEDELIFFFPPYQVAPYAAGSFQVRIPFSAIQTILAPPFA
jgi:peptidoglycan-N-acetylglucosamine deacetylase